MKYDTKYAILDAIFLFGLVAIGVVAFSLSWQMGLLWVGVAALNYEDL